MVKKEIVFWVGEALLNGYRSSIFGGGIVMEIWIIWTFEGKSHCLFSAFSLQNPQGNKKVRQLLGKPAIEGHPSALVQRVAILDYLSKLFCWDYIIIKRKF
jgi:hypothetical protein